MKIFFLLIALGFFVQANAYPHHKQLAYYRKKMLEMQEHSTKAYTPAHPRKTEIKVFSKKFYL